NLAYKAEALNPQITQKDVDLAKAELLPHLDVSTSLTGIDKVRAENSFGMQGRINWLVTGSLSQLIYSEPALANVTIQKLLNKSSEAKLLEEQLDLVVNTASAYLNILQAESFVRIQNENTIVTQENLDIAQAKEAVGYSGTTDLNRWRSELALRNIDLNDANAQLHQAKFQLNQILNRPINEVFATEDAQLEDQMLLVTDDRIDLVNNYGELQKFADFMVTEAMKQLPELSQIDYGISVQERLQLSRERAFYLPSVALSGNLDRPLSKVSVVGPVPAADNTSQWSIGVGVQYPILQGGRRKHNLEQTQLDLLQLRHQRADLRNQLEFRIRASLETAAASFSRVDLSKTAADAAQKNFEIIQDSYSQGLVNVTALIDAQNAALQTELSAVNALYTFIIDFLVLERSMGFFYFMASPAEQDAFFERLVNFLGTH
ncbi:MAG: TolC family protein, partial [Bacteroidota bacterium]